MVEREPRVDRLIRGLGRNMRVVIVAPIFGLIGLVTGLDGIGKSLGHVAGGAAAMAGALALVILAYIGGKPDR